MPTGRRGRQSQLRFLGPCPRSELFRGGGRGPSGLLGSPRDDPAAPGAPPLLDSLLSTYCVRICRAVQEAADSSVWEIDMQTASNTRQAEVDAGRRRMHAGPWWQTGSVLVLSLELSGGGAWTGVGLPWKGL